MSTTTSRADEQGALNSGRRRPLTWIAVAVGLVIVAAALAFAYMAWRMSYVPAQLDLATSRLSDQGLYRASYAPVAGPIAVNRIHSWTLHLETADGRPLENAQVVVDGDMPQHGHGLPTRPQVTQNMGNGDYLVEGLRFQMPGWWVMEFRVTESGRTDKIGFNLMLQ
jgi:hypothetical protein